VPQDTQHTELYRHPITSIYTYGTPIFDDLYNLACCISSCIVISGIIKSDVINSQCCTMC